MQYCCLNYQTYFMKDIYGVAICSILCQPHTSTKGCYSTVEIIPNLCHFKIRAQLRVSASFLVTTHIRSKNSQTLRTIIYYSSELNNKHLQVRIFCESITLQDKSGF